MFVYVNLHACGHCIHLPSCLIYEGVLGKKGLSGSFTEKEKKLKVLQRIKEVKITQSEN